MTRPRSDRRRIAAAGRRLSLRAITMLVVVAFAVTTAGLTFATYSGIKSRSKSLDTVVEQTMALKLYEDARSAGFAESAAAASYLGLPQQEFLDRFADSRVEVQSSLAALRELAAGDTTALQQISDLEQRHEALSGTYAAMLTSLERGDAAAAFQIAEDGDLVANAGGMWEALDAAIAGARADATTAQRDDAATQRTLDRILLAAVAAWTVVLAGAGIATYSWVVRPIRRVARAASGIAEGAVDIRSPVSGPAEVARLAQDVNSMADSLIDRSEKLNAYLSKDLETRTAELAQANAGLEQSEQRFRSLVQHAPDLITVVDVDGTVLYQSPSVRRVLGHEADELIGRQFPAMVHEDDQEIILAFLDEQASKPGEVINVEARIRHRDGTFRHLEIIGSDRRDDPVGGLVLNSRDITERKRLEEELRYGAFHDSLTGLANRASFMDRLEQALLRATRTQQTSAVLFIDLDNFKAINDSLGHDAGDEILASEGGRIRGCLRASDTAARLGGDEFAVLLESLDDPQDATRVAQRILDLHEAPFSYGGKDVFVRASIGVATSNGIAGDRRTAAQTILRNADVAMYAAKRDGKAYFEVYSDELHLALLRRLELVTDLRAAVGRGEFFIQYQPLVDLRTLDVLGLEALVRWRHPLHGLISPVDFIPLAEESGAIKALGRWVLNEACRQMRAWDDQITDGGRRYVSVNVSVQQLLDRRFVGEVRGILDSSALDPKRLTLEITESITMYPGDTTIRVLNELKEIGVRLAIDDFGTGASSFAYLRHFPFDVVKIDKSFVQHEEGTNGSRELTRKVIETGKLLNLEVIAEGIEEEVHLIELRDMGCEMGQGYFFAKPMDPQDVPAHLREALAKRAA